MRPWILAGALVALMLPRLGDARTAVRVTVDEGATRLELVDDTVDLNLVVVNPGAGNLQVRINLKFISPSATEISADRSALLKPGANTVRVRWPGFSKAFSVEDRLRFPWFRLQYHLATGDNESVHGTIAALSVMPLTYRLRMATPPPRGGTWIAKVFALDAGSDAGVEGVQLEGELDLEIHDQKKTLTARGRTDRSGQADLVFTLPPEADHAFLTVTGRRGHEIREVLHSFSVGREPPSVLITTDKPIYQPGQLLRIRMLAVASSGAALEGQRFQLEIEGPDGAPFHAELRTSRYGEAHTEWPIPENARLGSYRITVQDSSGGWLNGGGASVKVERYELPTFTVHAKGDRSFYLPGQKAEVEIQTTYLFGQPVAGARVKIVQDEPYSAYGRPKPPVPATLQKVEGTADRDGRFTVALDPWLSDDAPSAAADERLQSNDTGFTVSVTDPASGRTEEKRLYLRVSLRPIHIWIGRAQRLGDDGPVEFLLLTQYADGSPASCRVNIALEPDQSEGGAANVRRPLAAVTTNRFGVAQVSAPLRAKSSDDVSISFEAEDEKGNHGRLVDEPSIDEIKTLVQTDKLFYNAGDPLQVQVRSTRKTGPVIIDVLGNRRLVHTQVVFLNDGVASATFPYSTAFQERVTISARYVGGTDPDDDDGISRLVLYPEVPQLRLEVAPKRTVYAPGEDGSVSFRVRTAGNASAQGMLGIAIVDRAVEERARSTDRYYDDRDIPDAREEISRAIQRIDRSKAVPDDVRVAGEYLLNSYRQRACCRELNDEYIGTPADVFKGSLDREFKPVREALDRFAKDRRYPIDNAALRSLLADAGMDLDALRDFWDVPFQFVIRTSAPSGTLEAVSAGPDKRPGTADDFVAFNFFWPYFQKRGETLDRAVKSFRQSSGRYVRDLSGLREALQAAGEEVDSWRDPWGLPYRFEFAIDGTSYRIQITSGGPNKRFSVSGNRDWDDVAIWTSRISYVDDLRANIERAVNQRFQQNGTFPTAQAEFDEIVPLAGVAESDLIDPWGHRFYELFGASYEYANSYRIFITARAEITYNQYLETRELERRRSAAVPVTKEYQWVRVRSAGPDGIANTADDFDAVRILRLNAERFASEAAAKVTANATPILAGTAAMRGAVTDSSGGALPGARVTLSLGDVEIASVVTDEKGVYGFTNLKTGYYQARFELTGFSPLRLRDIPVTAGTTTMDVALEEASSVRAMATVGITLSDPLLKDPIVTIETELSPKPLPIAAAGFPGPMFTPRLREYFPETLVWQPALETDRNGNAELRFKLADNITAWKVTAIASTIDGRIARANAEILAFQPFFLEHDPPRLLTEGDTVALPVVLRSYLSKDQSLNVALRPENWFSPAGPLEQRVNVKAGETAQAVFSFKAAAIVRDGAHRVTATGTETGDSVLKPISVAPNGREMTRTESRVLGAASTVFQVETPPDAIPGAGRLEMTIYPSITSHVVNAIDGILQRPHGCAEQVISAAYPALTLLRVEKQTGVRNRASSARTRKILEEGYATLLGFQSESGGFTYWGGDSADVALTAYAIEFFHDAADFIAIDDRVLQRAVVWLAGQQRKDGSWSSGNAERPETSFSTLTLTSIVLRTLSQPDVAKLIGKGAKPITRDTIGDGMKYARERAGEWSEPYSLASLALAALNRSDRETAAWALNRLEASSHTEADSSFWDLQSNTPFYGWGLPGRLESTALSVQALIAGVAAGIQTDRAQSLADRGLMFLLRNKDRYGVWYSTQATARVLATLAGFAVRQASPSSRQHTEIFVNGTRVDVAALAGVALDADGTNPVRLDLSRFTRTGSNRVEIRGRGAGTVQIAHTWYVPWADATTDPVGPLRLAVRFNKTEGKIGDAFTAEVNVERVGFRGYGMMIAEIGLPPGVDVDRRSLDETMRTSELFRYDVLPDRIVVYLWPKAGGSRFQFKFHARYGIDAQTAPSVLYDYYNPEAQAAQKPARFVVR